MGKIVFRIAIDVMNASFHLFPLAYSVNTQHTTQNKSIYSRTIIHHTLFWICAKIVQLNNGLIDVQNSVFIESRSYLFIPDAQPTNSRTVLLPITLPITRDQHIEKRVLVSVRLMCNASEFISCAKNSIRFLPRNATICHLRNQSPQLIGNIRCCDQFHFRSNANHTHYVFSPESE